MEDSHSIKIKTGKVMTTRKSIGMDPIRHTRATISQKGESLKMKNQALIRE